MLFGMCIGIGSDDLVATGAFRFIQRHISSPEKDVDGVTRFPFSNAKAARHGDRLLISKNYQLFDNVLELLCDIDGIGQIAFHQ